LSIATLEFTEILPKGWQEGACGAEGRFQKGGGVVFMGKGRDRSFFSGEFEGGEGNE
jgi:hypothetical protein